MSRGKCLGIHHSDSVCDTPTERLGFTGKIPCADSPRENGRELTRIRRAHRPMERDGARETASPARNSPITAGDRPKLSTPCPAGYRTRPHASHKSGRGVPGGRAGGTRGDYPSLIFDPLSRFLMGAKGARIP
jgi:hypothetical protein